ncbi:hypothetical protein [Rhodoblastus sp.]|uniref:hypothetical protein n=1 Tax=Rhodoblastus sp. TaxID=1962975 RepID=UPI0025DE8024|nr:hypothetical protein [Rhodoblastus sp.]
MFKYAPPADVDDLAGRPSRAAFLDDWHAAIAANFADEIANLPPNNKLFFSEVATPATSADAPISWNAFPLSITRDNPIDPVARWDAADRLANVDRSPDKNYKIPMPCRVQDEYCEWFAYRQTLNGPITRIVFTAEAPEYWIALAGHDFDRVVELYRQNVSPSVQPDELELQQDIVFGDRVLKAGTYNPYNEWNTTKGLIHLTHPANTLGAEINLAARATIPRRDANGNRVTDVRRFACASNFGDPNRSSDPNIGIGVNLTAIPAAAGAQVQSITLANPVALYIDQLAAGTVTDAGGTPLSGWFKIVRGVTGRGLMAVLEPPPASPFGLDKIHIRGRALTHGGQVADRIQMVLYGKTANLGEHTPPLQRCIMHCCCATAIPDVGKVNLDHNPVADICDPVTSKDAFPELIGPDAAPALAAAKNESGATVTKLGLTRLAGGRDVQ